MFSSCLLILSSVVISELSHKDLASIPDRVTQQNIHMYMYPTQIKFIKIAKVICSIVLLDNRYLYRIS